MRILTAFANQHAAECERIIGVNRRAAYVYEHETSPGRNLFPRRAFRDSNGQWFKEGAGFPSVAEPTPDLGLVRGAQVLCINAEFYGPEWELVRPAMRALGLQRHDGSRERAQECLVDKLVGFADAAADAARRAGPEGLGEGVAGLYGFAPFASRAVRPEETWGPEHEKVSDHRLRVLMRVTAYMPSLYVYNPSGQRDERGYLSDMPKTETVPIVCGHYSYHWPEPVSAEHWAKVWERALGFGAARAVLWGDCGAAESIELAKRTAENLRAGAAKVGITIE